MRLALWFVAALSLLGAAACNQILNNGDHQPSPQASTATFDASVESGAGGDGAARGDGNLACASPGAARCVGNALETCGTDRLWGPASDCANQA